MWTTNQIVLYNNKMKEVSIGDLQLNLLLTCSPV